MSDTYSCGCGRIKDPNSFDTNHHIYSWETADSEYLWWSAVQLLDRPYETYACAPTAWIREHRLEFWDPQVNNWDYDKLPRCSSQSPWAEKPVVVVTCRKVSAEILARWGM